VAITRALATPTGTGRSPFFWAKSGEGGQIMPVIIENKTAIFNLFNDVLLK